MLSTGAGEQHGEHRRGTRLPQLWWVLTSRSWVRVPINVFVIEHRDGLVLFDTGLDPAIVSDPRYVDSAVGRLLLRRIFRLHIDPADALASKLEALGHAPSEVTKVVVSHLHFDHIGGIAAVPQAELLVSRREWQQLESRHPEREWVLREHIEIPGARWRPIEFAASPDPLLAPFGGIHDVMRDGSMVLLPTPGHTPGSISMLVRTAGLPPLLLVADLTYEVDLLMRDQVPGTGDAAQLRASFAKVRALREQLPGLLILPSHDPGAAQALSAAMEPPAVRAAAHRSRAVSTPR
ncbi:MAG: N-acyl homoserine lactonase family protein [Burkholderiales bacterium]|nr:MAG: N-acyl homoserine lactonase family protein [Burkholderiales bacterium]